MILCCCEGRERGRTKFLSFLHSVSLDFFSLGSGWEEEQGRDEERWKAVMKRDGKLDSASLSWVPDLIIGYYWPANQKIAPPAPPKNRLSPSHLPLPLLLSPHSQSPKPRHPPLPKNLLKKKKKPYVQGPLPPPPPSSNPPSFSTPSPPSTPSRPPSPRPAPPSTSPSSFAPFRRLRHLRLPLGRHHQGRRLPRPHHPPSLLLRCLRLCPNSSASALPSPKISSKRRRNPSLMPLFPLPPVASPHLPIPHPLRRLRQLRLPLRHHHQGWHLPRPRHPWMHRRRIQLKVGTCMVQVGLRGMFGCATFIISIRVSLWHRAS